MKHASSYARTSLTLLAFVLCMTVPARSFQKTTPQPDLAIEMINAHKRPIEFPAFNGGGAGGIAPSFISKSVNPDPSARVNSLVLAVTRDGHIVIIALSVIMENDKKILVASYRLKENDVVRTEELTKYDVEPLSLKVVRAKPQPPEPPPPIQPLIENKTQFIHVVGFNRSSHSSNSFELSLRNISTKAIIGLSLWMPSADGNGGQGQTSHGSKSHPVMLPGAESVYHISVSNGGRLTPNGFVADVPAQQTMIIRTVVFDDGSFDGLVEPAAEMAARRRGANIQDIRVGQLLEVAAKSNLSFEQLKDGAYALDKTVDDSIALELKALFPTLTERSKETFLSGLVAGMRDSKSTFLHKLDEFLENQNNIQRTETLNDWLKRTREEYAKLIADY